MHEIFYAYQPYPQLLYPHIFKGVPMRSRSTASLDTFIASNPDSRELKRALAVKMSLSQYTHQQIQDILGVTSGFISKWNQRYLASGIEELGLAHRGSEPYLSAHQHRQVLDWLGQKTKTSVSELAGYIDQQFDVHFKSRQSYYDLLGEAKISWKKSQPKNPKADPEQVAEKKEEVKKTSHPGNP